MDYHSQGGIAHPAGEIMTDTRLAGIERKWVEGTFATITFYSGSSAELQDDAKRLIKEVKRKNEALELVLAYFKTLGWIRGTVVAETVERALEEAS